MSDIFRTVFPGIYDRREARDVGSAKRQLLLQQIANQRGMADAQAALIPGIPDSNGVSYNTARPLGGVPSIMNLDDITGGVSQGILSIPSGDPAAERAALLNQAFPEQAIARAGAAAFPAPPTVQKYGPGDVGVMQGIDPATGQPFTRQIFAAPFAPKVQGPESPLGKLNADYKAGLIDKAAYNAGVAKENRIPNDGATSTKAVFDRKTGKNTFATDSQISSDPDRYASPVTPPTVKLFNAEGQEIGTGDPNDPTVQAKIASGEVRTATPRSFNNDQNKAAGFANTMADAEARISRIGSGDPSKPGFVPFDPTSATESARGITNLTASENYQKYKQGALDWTLAILRQESGANVPNAEAEKYWTNYFPQYGDSKGVIEQKAQSRASKMQGVVSASGGAYDALRKKADKPSGPAAVPAPPAAAISALKANPALKGDFEEKYGSGAAAKYLLGG